MQGISYSVRLKCWPFLSFVRFASSTTSKRGQRYELFLKSPNISPKILQNSPNLLSHIYNVRTRKLKKYPSTSDYQPLICVYIFLKTLTIYEKASYNHFKNYLHKIFLKILAETKYNAYLCTQNLNFMSNLILKAMKKT
jgi:hypothetical protein